MKIPSLYLLKFFYKIKIIRSWPIQDTSTEIEFIAVIIIAAGKYWS